MSLNVPINQIRLPILRQLPSLHPWSRMSQFHFIAVRKHPNQKQWEEEMICLACTLRSQSITEGSWGKNSDRSWKQKRQMNVSCWLVHSHAHAQIASLHNPEPPVQGMVPPMVGWALLHQFRPSKQYLTYVFTDQLSRGSYSIEALCR